MHSVAPHVGAWIETLSLVLFYRPVAVAPHVGAWIETMRVLLAVLSKTIVAPHVGAWIETFLYLQRN